MILNENKGMIRENFTMIPNEINRSGLTVEQAGMYCLLQTLPPDWSFSAAGLAARLNSSPAKIRRLMRELSDLDLVRTETVRENGRYSGVDVRIMPL